MLTRLDPLFTVVVVLLVPIGGATVLRWFNARPKSWWMTALEIAFYVVVFVGVIRLAMEGTDPRG